MDMVTISVCIIVKNEEEDLKRCLDCFNQIADEIIIVDTGSTDRTKEIAYSYSNQVYDFKWNDNFSDARNFSFSKATKDYIYTADADEVIDEENQKRLLALKEKLSGNIEIVQMQYSNQLQFNCTYNFDNEYRPKLFKRLRTFHWIDPIHESVDLNVSIYNSDIVIQHRPSSLHAPRDFSIFQHFISDEKLSSKIHCLYARELFIAGTDSDFVAAYPYFESTLHDEQKEINEIRASQCVVARASRLLKDDLTFFKTALKSIIGKPIAEICCELGKYYEEKQDYEEAATWYYTAVNGAECELDIHYSGDYPLLGLSECYDKLGDAAEALNYREEAAKWTIPVV